jgi:hypothetical protein
MITCCTITENEELVIELKGATPEGCMYNALVLYDVATLLFASYPMNHATLAGFIQRTERNERWISHKPLSSSPRS